MVDWKSFWYFFNTNFNNTECHMNAGLGSSIPWKHQKHLIEFLVDFLFPHFWVDWHKVWKLFNEKCEEDADWSIQQQLIEQIVEEMLEKAEVSSTSRVKRKIPYLRNYDLCEEL